MLCTALTEEQDEELIGSDCMTLILRLGLLSEFSISDLIGLGILYV